MQARSSKKNIKYCDEIFHEWQVNQSIIENSSLNSFHLDTSEQSKQRFEKQYTALKKRFAAHPASLQQLNNVVYGNAKITFPPQKMMQLLHYLRTNDIASFINCLTTNRFATHPLNAEEEKLSINKVTGKYNSMMRLLFAQEKRNEQNNLLYALANRLFTFCFAKQTYRQFQDILQQPRLHPLARMVYSIIWNNLMGNGWITWHENALKALKTQARQGKEIVYIAGGNDIYQLIKHGIYTIRVIDPFLPTQSTYYSDGWRFLLQGNKVTGIGDQIRGMFGKKNIIMKRTSYTTHGTFKATLSNGTTKKLPLSTTTWQLFENGQSRPRGTITIERRFTHQDDFIHNNNQALLLSINELYFITTSDELSWGIDVGKFDPKLKLHIKQLAKPLSKNMLVNMQKADALDTFHFIQLGNCID